MRSFHHENTRTRCLFYHERIRKRRKNIFSGISIFSDVFGIEGFYIPKKAERTKKTKKHFFGYFDIFGCFRNKRFLYPEKGGKDEKDENVVLGCLGCLQKNNGRFVIKDNEDNGGQLFYHEKYEKTFCFLEFRYFRMFSE